MVDIYFTNSLSGKKEKFVPIKDDKVGVYTCGPTVYDYPTIGNWRTYVLSDLVVRTLKYFGYQVNYVMNVTDVGHLVTDSDTGEDKMEKGARREGRTAWEIADFYIKDFKKSFEKLNLLKPNILCRATDHIKEQIELVKKLGEHGLIYKIDDGVYFDVRKYENGGYKYGELSTLDKIREGARVEMNPQKLDPRDFALWKFTPGGVSRDMEWNSPWGVGFPGWHLECSAMSMKYLGEQFDIHIGGEDLRSTHHPNEIAQSEAATNKKPFVKYWIHGAFLLIDGKRMGKSEGNAYTLQDVEDKKFDELDLRYFYLTGHYRKQMNFTWAALKSSKISLDKLRELVIQFGKAKERTELSQEKLKKVENFRVSFNKAIANDLNAPEALALTWDAAKSNIPDYDKYDLIQSFDEILELALISKTGKIPRVPKVIKDLIEEREKLRKNGKFEDADEIRKKIYDLGYMIEDTSKEPKLKQVAS